jgi:hypothetical protein
MQDNGTPSQRSENPCISLSKHSLSALVQSTSPTSQQSRYSPEQFAQVLRLNRIPRQKRVGESMKRSSDDVWRMASLLIKDRGSEAAFVAMRMATELLLLGDAEEYAHWRCIAESITVWENKSQTAT